MIEKIGISNGSIQDVELMVKINELIEAHNYTDKMARKVIVQLIKRIEQLEAN